MEKETCSSNKKMNKLKKRKKKKGLKMKTQDDKNKFVESAVNNYWDNKMDKNFNKKNYITSENFNDKYEGYSDNNKNNYDMSYINDDNNKEKKKKSKKKRACQKSEQMNEKRNILNYFYKKDDLYNTYNNNYVDKLYMNIDRSYYITT